MQYFKHVTILSLYPATDRNPRKERSLLIPTNVIRGATQQFGEFDHKKSFLP